MEWWLVAGGWFIQFWEFTKQYAGQLLLKSKLDRMFFGFQGSSHERKQLLHTYRIRIVKHYAVRCAFRGNV